MRGSSFRPRPHQATHFWTSEPSLMPDQARQGTRRQGDQRVLPPGDPSHRRSPRTGATLDGPDALHVHAKWTFAENIHLGKSDKALIDGGRVSNHGGSSVLCRR